MTDRTSDTAEPLGVLLSRAGLAVVDKELNRLVAGDKLVVNGAAAGGETPIRAGDIVAIAGLPYTAVSAGIHDRLHLAADRAAESGRKTGPVRVHCGFHKCLTIYSRHTYAVATSRLLFGRPRGFKHFYHRLDAFYTECEDYRVSSVSGHVIDLDRFDDIRVVRFMRDPRDLLVSGYFYHRRGAEEWCLLDDPVEADWAVVNGKVPDALPAGTSMTAYLNGVSQDEGLAAEFEFRRNHFDTMRDWPADGERIRTYRYEDIMGHERELFDDALGFLGLPWYARRAGAASAHRHRATNPRQQTNHIRNARSGQWRDILPADVVARFADEYGDMLERYGYPRR